MKTSNEIYKTGFEDGVEKGRLKAENKIKDIGLFITNGTDKDIQVVEFESISEDEDKEIELGIIKKECGLRVYPTNKEVCIKFSEGRIKISGKEQLSKEIVGIEKC